MAGKQGSRARSSDALPRALSARTIAAAGAALLALGAAGAAETVDLVVASWGGAYANSQRKAYHEPYMAANPGITIVDDLSAIDGLAKLRAQAESGQWRWDLVDMTAGDAIAACDEGLVLELDHDTLLAPAPDGELPSEDFLVGTLLPGDSNCFIPEIAYSTTFGYSADAWGGKQMTRLMDVFDLENFPGKRGLEKRPNNNLEWALVADGVAPDEIYDTLSTAAGLARAFRKLDTIRDQIIWWEDGERPVQLLARGEVVISSAYNGRLFNGIEVEKHPIAMMWQWQVLDLDGWVIPKGTKHLDEVMKFVRFATDSQRLADQASYIPYAPTRKSSMELVGRHAVLGIDMKPHMPTNPDNAKDATLITNFVWWADNKAEMDKEFDAWLAAK